jgi:diguanylate cyclase (GGDEF)-like protein/PAS domain S-box-containing protein
MKDQNALTDAQQSTVSQQLEEVALDALSAHICILDQDGIIRYVNTSWRDFANANQLESPDYGVGVNYLEICDLATGADSQGAREVATGIRQVIDGKLDAFSFDYPCHGPTVKRWFNIRATRFEDSGDLGVIVTHDNISTRKQIEESLIERELKYQAIFEGVADAIFIMHRERYVDCNPSTLRMFACTREQIIGQSPPKFSPPHQPDGSDSEEKALEYIHSALSGEPQRFEWTYIKADGSPFEAEVRLKRLVLGGEPHLLASVRDISEWKRYEEKIVNANTQLENRLKEIQKLQIQLKEQAIRDPLTGLYNRRYLEENMAQTIARADRYKYPISLVMLDIDHFKIVNDTYGHKAGDEMLVALSELLQSQIRKGDTICRYGGEEFVVLMPRASWETARDRAEQLRLAFGNLHLPYEGKTLNTTLSAGIATLSPENNDIEDAMREADIAMYRSKTEGRNRITVSERFRG